MTQESDERALESLRVQFELLETAFRRQTEATGAELRRVAGALSAAQTQLAQVKGAVEALNTSVSEVRELLRDRPGLR